MDKAAALAIIAGKGINTAGMEGLPDDQLIAIATALQGCGDPTQMSNAVRQFTDQTRQFADQAKQMQGTITTLKSELDALKTRQEVTESNAKTVQQQQIERGVHVFCDDLRGRNQCLPADVGTEAAPGPYRERLLRAAKSPQIHTFADKSTKTELELQMEELRKLPVLKFGDKLGTGKAGDVSPGGASNPPDALDTKADTMLAKRYGKAPAAAAASN